MPVDVLEIHSWLNKRGVVNANWKRRWFVLRGNELMYFRQPKVPRFFLQSLLMLKWIRTNCLKE